MKKRILLILAAIFSLCLLLTVSAAAASEPALIQGTGESLIYQDKTYLRLTLPSGLFDFDYDATYPSVDLPLSCEEERTAEFFDDYYGEALCDFVIMLRPGDMWEGYRYISYYYIEASHWDEISEVNKGIASEYYPEYYARDDTFDITPAQIAQWKNSTRTMLPAPFLAKYEPYTLICKDSTGCYQAKIGQILRDFDDPDKYYLLLFDDCPAECVSEDTEIITSYSQELPLYELEDESLAFALSEYFDYTPADDLEWVVNEDSSDLNSLIFAIILFGVLPLALCIVCLVFILKRVKNPTRICLIFIGIASLVVIACFAGVLIILL